MDYLHVTKIGLNKYSVHSLSYNKHKIVTKDHTYEVNINPLNISCNCIFMQKYNFDTNKVCKHINAVNQIITKQINRVKDIINS